MIIEVFRYFHKKIQSSTSAPSDYIIKDNVEEEKKNPLRDLILRKVKFKDFLTADYSKKEEF